jgi:hypothetical protein
MRAIHLAIAAAIVPAAALLCEAPAGAGEKPPADEPNRIRYGEPSRLCVLANRRIHESSGLAPSRLRDGVLWTHNDSGDRPRVYALDANGADLATLTLRGAKAHDWEDMASFRLGGRPWLLLADVGDNKARRKTCRLYVVREPNVPPAAAKRRKGLDLTAEPAVTIEFTYADGPHDCEAVAVDANARRIYLASKTAPLAGKIYVLPLPAKSPTKVLQARPIARLPMAFATGMDMSPDGRRAVIVTYGATYEFARRRGETWAQAFARPPRSIPTPKLKQGEAICYGRGGRSLYLTSEKLPAPLWRVPAK